MFDRGKVTFEVMSDFLRRRSFHFGWKPRKKETEKKDLNRKKEKSTPWRSFYEPIKRTEMVVPSIFEVRFMTQLEKIEHEPRNL